MGRTVLALVLPDRLRCGQPAGLLGGFGINDGSVAALKILHDRHRVALALLHFTLQEVVIKIVDKVGGLD